MELKVSSVSEPLVMRALVKVAGWSKDFPWLPTWFVVNLLVDNCLGHNLDIQNFDDTLYCATPALGSTSLLGRWCRPCHLSSSWFRLCFAPCKATGSVQLWSSILIWRAGSIFLVALGVPWSYFPLFWFWSGCWLHSRIFLPLCVANHPLSAW